MRWIFLTLVLANVGLFIWSSVESSHQDRWDALSAKFEPSEAMPGDKLMLVNELTEEQRRELDRVKPAAISNPKPEVKEVVESQASLTDMSASSSDASAETVNQPIVPIQCFLYGPVANTTQAGQLSQRFVAVGIISDTLELEFPGDPEYWVILPSSGDDKAALRKLKEVQGRNLNAQVILKGPLINAISFGLFGQKHEAEKQAGKIRQLGYHVEVRSLPGLKKENWIFLNERQSPKLSDALWQGIQKDFPRLIKKPYRCR